MRAGNPPETPAVIVRRCSWPDQETFRCTLGAVADEIQSRHLRPPALVVVGPVAAVQAGHRWFVDRPLFGARVLVTRAPHQAQSLAAALGELGAAVLLQPVVEVSPPDDWAPVDRVLARLHDFDWL